MKIDGGCHCGAITYEAEVDPSKVGICHCTDCQILTGTVFRVTVPVPEDKLVMRGEPTIYVKTAESGNKRAQGFCGSCGTQLFATSVGDGPKVYGLRTGTARQRDRLVPRREVFRRSALAWMDPLSCVELTIEDGS
jgi:hypothetical protein